MTLEFINAFLHLLYDQQDYFIDYLFASKENLEATKKQLSKMKIHFDFIDHLDERAISLCLTRKSVDVIDNFIKDDVALELTHFRNHYKKKNYVLFLPGFEQNELNLSLIQPMESTDSTIYLYLDRLLNQEDLVFINPCSLLMEGIYQLDKWPAILNITDHKVTFNPITSLKQLKQKEVISPIKEDESYFIHLSDLHLGTKKNNQGKIALFRSLDRVSQDLNGHPLHFIITGDLMNSPNSKNMYLASSFMNDLKKRYQSDVTFILGNHDMIVHGINFLRVQKSKIVAYLLGEKIKIFKKEKIVMVKINSAREGNLARGKVGTLQMQEIDEELKTIPNIHEYQIVVLIHHHVLPITKAHFLKKKWNEGKFVGKILDTTKALVDSQELLDWLHLHHVHYVLHGHKHIPFFQKDRECYFVSCGSSCGVVKEENSHPYLSYNILKYDNASKQMKLCLIYYEGVHRHEGRIITAHLFK